MASSLNYSFHPRSIEPAAAAERRNISREAQPREFAFTLKQVLALWSFLAFAIFLAATMGFYAGREEGVQLALEAAGSQAIRIPVVNPGSSPSSAAPKALSTLAAPASPAELSTPALEASREVAFDFSSSQRTEMSRVRPANSTTFNLKQLELSGDATSARENAELALFKDDSSRSAPPQSAPTGVEKREAAAAPAVASSKVETPFEAPANVREAAAVPAKLQAGKPAPAVKPVGEWYVQLVAGKSKQEADATIKKTNQLGLNGAIEIAKVKDRTFFRVLIGPYPDRAQATAVSQKLRTAKVTASEPFVRRVKRS